MTTPPTDPLTCRAPSWPHCAHGAAPAADPVGCRGIHVVGHTTCLAHLSDTDRALYLDGLAAGADVDHHDGETTLLRLGEPASPVPAPAAALLLAYIAD
ncbi:hypothetical protein ACIHCV_44935, partial [Streptomyces sp. NPDC051956]